jgi:hypothetical protein
MKTHKVNVCISYQPRQGGGKPIIVHEPGSEADLSDWPADDMKRFEEQGIVERLPEPEPRLKGKSASKETEDAI